MKLTFEQIKNISTGAVRFKEDENGIKLYRFTEEQEKLYEEADLEFYNRSKATAGMKFAFRTNSNNLYINTRMVPRYCRKYFTFDVFVNDELVGCLDNLPIEGKAEDYINVKLEDKIYEKKFVLGEGDKTVVVYLPWSVQPVFKEISIDDGAFVEAVKSEKTLLAFGDSITQGMDAMYTSNRYVAKLAKFLEADEINKGISGECFFPALAESEEKLNPDYITVAYGTNDWSKKGRDVFSKNCKAFYASLSKRYPNAKIFAMTPIWRADHMEYREFGLFEDVESEICNAVKELQNVTVIRGYDFVPHDTNYFADGRLHPNDKGFQEYFDKLNIEIAKCLEK